MEPTIQFRPGYTQLSQFTRGEVLGMVASFSRAGGSRSEAVQLFQSWTFVTWMNAHWHRDTVVRVRTTIAEHVVDRMHRKLNGQPARLRAVK